MKLLHIPKETDYDVLGVVGQMQVCDWFRLPCGTVFTVVYTRQQMVCGLSLKILKFAGSNGKEYSCNVWGFGQSADYISEVQ